jgi:membrane dipeptidase
MRAILLLSIMLMLGVLANSQDPGSEKERWRQLHFTIKTIDTHCDLPMKMSWYDMGEEHDFGYVDLPRMKKGGLNGEFMAAFVPQGQLDSAGREGAYKKANEMIDLIEKQCLNHKNLVEIGRSAEDFEKITSSGKICIFISIENGYPIGLDINKLDFFYNRGARYMTLCHFDDNDICDSSTDEDNPEDQGLSEFGIRVVKRMNELGMIVDVSHISQKSFFDVIQHSKKPIIASHSCIQGVKDHPQNLTDKQLMALKKNGGVVQINLVPSHLRKPVDVPEMQEEMGKVISWLDSRGGYEKLNVEERDYFTRETRRIKLKYPQGVGLVSEFVDHIDYVKNLIGIDYVGIGTDFEGGGCLGDCYTVLDIPNITVELFKRGYTKSEVEKVWSGNFLRVFKEVERTD